VAVGVTQPGGAGTTIFYYDNASASNGLYYTFAEIAAAFPADFIDNGTATKTYRSKVSLQCGDTGVGTATTTLQDTNVGVFFDANRTMLWRATQTTSWNLNLGTKVGTGNEATGRNGCTIYTPATAAGTTLRGNLALYGTTWVTGAGVLGIANTNVSGLTTELIECRIGHTGTTSTAVIAIGGTTVPITNVYNLDIWSNVSAAATGIVTNFNATNAERVTIGGPSMVSIMRSPSNVIAVKDIRFFGTASTSDIQPSGSPTGWDFVRPQWSGNAPRMGVTAVAAGIIRELWIADTKVVDRNGDGVSSISVKVTDSIGTVQVNTTTDATGRIAFGSGLLTNAMIVRDHYGDGVSYLTRDRSPFLFEINVTNQNTSYPALRYYTDWPTDASGNFEDMADPIPLQYASGTPTTWVEAAL
jgi:hypothetical protein